MHLSLFISCECELEDVKLSALWIIVVNKL